MFHIKQGVSNFLCYLFLVNHLVAVIYYLRHKPLQSMLWTIYSPIYNGVVRADVSRNDMLYSV